MIFKKKLCDLIGPIHVINSGSDLKGFSNDCSPFSGVSPSYLVRPGNSDEVRSVIRLANQENIPVIPVSSGIHFDGTTLPSQGGIILDLGRMNRIIEVDVRNRRARIEPGVRWGQLQDHLKNMGMVAMNPLFPHPLQSVISSYLERQPLLIPKFEYAEPILTLEVVLPSGDLLRTGSAASPGAPDDTVVDMVCPYGPGLDFYRLFQGAQGTLGAVTWMNIKIEYLSSLRKTYYIQSDHLSDLLPFVHHIQRLMIGNECFILKRPDMSAIASGGNQRSMEFLRQEIKEWTAVIQIAGTRRRPEERILYQDQAFHEISLEYRMNPRSHLTESGIETKIFEYGLREPWPEDKAYWKFLAKGGCHDIAFHTTFENLPKIVGEAEEFLLKMALDEIAYGLYIQPLEYGRAYYTQFHFFYDPRDQGQKQKIIQLDQACNQKLLFSGVLFNTPYGAQSSLIYDHATIYATTLKKVKKIFDPAEIMNPGRLCF